MSKKRAFREPSIVDSLDSEGYTKLHRAIIKGNIKIVRDLVERGADVRIRTPAGFNAAELAMHFDNSIITKYLPPLYKKQEQQLLIHTAAGLNNVQSVRYLLKLSVGVNSRDASKRTALHWAAQENSLACAHVLVSNGSLVDSYDDLKVTPLAIAVGEGHLKFVNFLLNNGANPNRKTIEGGTPLHVAFAYDQKEIIKVLIKAGAKLNVKNDEGKTPEMQ